MTCPAIPFKTVWVRGEQRVEALNGVHFFRVFLGVAAQCLKQIASVH
jgi:hypothetical protein